jgi:hypothetical protein
MCYDDDSFGGHSVTRLHLQIFSLPSHGRDVTLTKFPFLRRAISYAKNRHMFFATIATTTRRVLASIAYHFVLEIPFPRQLLRSQYTHRTRFLRGQLTQHFYPPGSDQRRFAERRVRSTLQLFVAGSLGTYSSDRSVSGFGRPSS